MTDYVYQPYPAWRYHATKTATIVADAAADAALGEGWFDSPAKIHEPPVATPLPVEEPPGEEPPGLEVPEEPAPPAKPVRRPHRATAKTPAADGSAVSGRG